MAVAHSNPAALVPAGRIADRGGAGLTLALLSAASFSTSGTFARSLDTAGWSPGAAVVARIGCAALVLLVPGLFALRGRWSVLRRSGGTIALYGLVTIAGSQLCYFYAVAHLSVGVALLLEYLGIVLIVGYLWLWRGQRPRRLTLIGSAVALVGLVLVIDVFGGARLDPIGVVWALGAAVGLATYFVISSNAEDDVPPLVLAGGGMIVGAVALGALGAWIACRRARAELGPVAGAVAPALVFGLAIGGLGNWWTQQFYGPPSSWWWAVRISPTHRVPGYENYATFQPAFLYLSLWEVALGFAVIWAARRFALSGDRTFMLCAAGYAAGDFWAQTLRAGPLPHALGVRYGALGDIAVFVFAVLGMYLTRSGGRRPARAPAKRAVVEDSSGDVMSV